MLEVSQRMSHKVVARRKNGQDQSREETQFSNMEIDGPKHEMMFILTNKRNT